MPAQWTGSIVGEMHLYGIKGIELARRIKETSKNTRIIFATGYSEYALEAFKADAVDYVLKPYEPERIRQAYDKALLIKDVEVTSHIFVKTFITYYFHKIINHFYTNKL